MGLFEYFVTEVGTFTSGCIITLQSSLIKEQPAISRGKEVTRTRVPLFSCCWHEYFGMICLLISDSLLLLILKHGEGDLTVTLVPLLINRRSSSSQPCGFLLLCNLIILNTLNVHALLCLIMWEFSMFYASL